MKTQSGRSMIEMLGVLAIIGVLSIGGLAGYTRAMNSYQANQLMDYMNRCSVVVQENLAVGAGAPANCAAALPGETAPVAGTITYARVPAEGAQTGFTLTTTAGEPDADVRTTIANKTPDGAVVGGVNWAINGTSIRATYTL